ncbi:hypothetical protein GCM10010121_098960 [Streptomyces brasiliensis]|uniref:Integrase catalytic domain-containing protein n=1 Tax=Streptomyces brasiliensis TaxID=1954 RepID=A0A917PE59_9ACTN|nr:hypothetical protein GCM10010121_098960 [Streptomyces brasiliensis]
MGSVGDSYDNTLAENLWILIKTEGIRGRTFATRAEANLALFEYIHGFYNPRRITPAYRPTLVEPYRDHLRARRAADPAIPITQLLREIRELGYTGSANLPVRYLNQARAEGGDRPITTPRHASRLLLTNPENPRPKEASLLEKIAAACPETTALAELVRDFAALLKPAEGNDTKPTEWITAARAVDLPHLRSLLP